MIDSLLFGRMLLKADGVAALSDLIHGFGMIVEEEEVREKKGEEESWRDWKHASMEEQTIESLLAY